MYSTILATAGQIFTKLHEDLDRKGKYVACPPVRIVLVQVRLSSYSFVFKDPSRQPKKAKGQTPIDELEPTDDRIDETEGPSWPVPQKPLLR
jgi:hypothetical protein